MGTGGDTDNQQCVEQQILLDASFEQVSWNQETIVYVEHDEKGEGDDTAVAQLVLPGDVESASRHHQQGETEYDSPAYDVYQDFDATAAWVGKLQFHHDTKIIFLYGY